MANNKVTIKDVAREAGVSTAAVSYVINNRADGRISEATRKKILQVVNLLDYSPNKAAKSLATNRKSIFAIYVPSSNSILVEAEYMHSVKVITSYFHNKNYDTLLLSDDTLSKCDQADAIICLDASSEEFRVLGDSNFIPLVALNCMINDPLFFQINSDPNKLINAADEFFKRKSYKIITLTSPNSEKLSFYRRYFDNLEIVSSFDDLPDLYNNNLLVFDSVLYSLLKDKSHVCYIPSLSDYKLGKLLSAIDEAMSRKPADSHDILV
ncbi:MAG: LacI family DNA-binding transcriptional regulator [Candidatus Weimeria sp.]